MRKIARVGMLRAPTTGVGGWLLVTQLILSGAAHSSVVRLHSSPYEISSVDTVRHPDGGLTVAWIGRDSGVDFAPFRVLLRNFDAAGNPTGEIVEVLGPQLRILSVKLSSEPSGAVLAMVETRSGFTFGGHSCDAAAYNRDGSVLWPLQHVGGAQGHFVGVSCVAAATPEGGWMAFWLTINDINEARPRLFSRRIALSTGAVGDRLLLKTIDGNAQIAGIASSGDALRAAWLETAPGSDPPEGRLVTQALDSAGQLSGLLVEIPIATEFDIYSATFRGIADGRFLVAWVQQLGDSPAEAFGAVVSDGPPPAPAVSLPSLSLEVDSAGRAMVGWWELLGSPPAYPWPTRIWRQGFAVTGVPLTAAVSVATVPRQSFPSVSVSSNGNWVLALN